MFAVIIHEKGGQPRRQAFTKNEVTIGRVQGNDIILPKQNVSKRHSRIVVKDGKFIIVDLKSTNGTYVNGRKIASPMVIKSSDKIYIGDFIISVEGDEAPETMEPMEPSEPMVAPAPEPVRTNAPPPPPPPRPAPAPVPVAPAAPARPAPPPPAPPAPIGLGPLAPSPISAPPPPPPPPPPAPIAPPAPVAPARPMPAAPRPAAPAAPVAPPAMVAPPVAQPRPAAPIAPPAPTPAPIRTTARPAAPARRPASLNISSPSDGPGLALELHARLQEAFVAEGAALPTSYQPANGLDDALYQKAEALVLEAIKGINVSDPDGLAASIALEAVGIGPLTSLLAESGVQRICINGPNRIFTVRQGQTEPTGVHFTGPTQVALAVERLLKGVGVTIPSGAAFAEGYLADGTRLHAALAAVGGPFVTLDRPAPVAETLDDLVAGEVLGANMALFLTQAVRCGKAIVVAGNDVDARFAFISALLTSGAPDLRVVAIEGGARLDARQPQLVTLSGAPGADGLALIQQALKMRPERLVVADCRGVETYAALTAISGAVNGGILGVDAESPDDALIRLVRQAALAVPGSDEQVDALVREVVAVLVQVLRYADGTTCVTSILDLDGETREVFSGLGGFRPTGHVPRWVSNAQSLGHPVDLNLFR